MKKLALHLVTWNGEKYLPYFFDSLKKQSFQDFRLYIWDNGSTDGSVAILQRESAAYPDAVLMLKTENSGFAGGHNALYAQSEEPYIAILNQDMYFEPDCFQRVVEYIESHADVGAVSPRLMRWHFGQENQAPPLVDSLGLSLFRSRRVVDLYQGSAWDILSPRFAHRDAIDVFGVSGACAFFRRSALDQVAFSKDEYFDALYGSYKEDVDLAFRLQSAGFRSSTVLSAVAYHDRTGMGPREMGDVAAAENKRKQKIWVKKNSYRNHLMTLYKNEYWENLVRDFPWIVWYEGKKFVWFLLFDRPVLRGLSEIWSMRKILREKRDYIRARRHVSFQELRRWFV